jgi:maltose O-acetyltransferase
MKREKEKMVEGLPYKASDETIQRERQHARELIFMINTSHPSEKTKLRDLFISLIGRINGIFLIEPPFQCDFGYNINIGDNFYANYNLVILDSAKVTIGDNVLIGPNVGIFTAGHPVHPELREMGYEFASPITIRNNVWIGGNVVINPGIKIGDNSVVGSGSVVTKDVPANVVAAGNPCKVLRDITERDRRYYYRNLEFILPIPPCQDSCS